MYTIFFLKKISVSDSMPPIALLLLRSIFLQASILTGHLKLGNEEIAKKWFAWDVTLLSLIGGQEAKQLVSFKLQVS